MEQAKEHIDTYFPVADLGAASRECGMEEDEAEEEEPGGSGEDPSASVAPPVLGDGRGGIDAPSSGNPSSCCWWENEEADPELIRRYVVCQLVCHTLRQKT